MTPEQLATLKAYLAKPDDVAYTFNGETYQLAKWVELRGDGAVAACLSDVAVGAALGKTRTRDQVPANELKAAIAQSDEFPTMPSSVMDKLAWFISTDPFPMGNASMRNGVLAVLEPFVGAVAKFDALTTTSASIAQALIGQDVTSTDISAALA